MSLSKINFLLQVFTREVREEEISKIFSLHYDSETFDSALVSNLLFHGPHEDHELEGRLFGADA